MDILAIDEAAADAASKYTATRPSTTVSMLIRGSQDVNIALLGDSTGNEVTEWFYRMLVGLAAMFPQITITYRLWNDTTQSYDAPVTIQTGTGPRTLNVYNCSVPGENVTYASATGSTTRVTTILPVQMHALFFSYGYNLPSATSYRETASYAINQLLNFHPRAEVFVCSQPPLASTSAEPRENHLLRQDSIRAMAEQEGWTIIDATQAFLDYAAATDGSFDDLIQADLKHPNAAGSQVWANEALRVVTKQPVANQRPPRGAPVNHLWIPAKQFDIVAGTPAYGWMADVEAHTWAFDPATIEEVATTVLIPPSWTKTVWRLFWHNPGNTGQCQWILRTGRLSSWLGTVNGGSSTLTAIGNIQATGTGATPVRVQQMYNGRDSAAIFEGRGVDAGFPAKVKVTRQATDSGDSSPADAHLIGLMIERVG